MAIQCDVSDEKAVADMVKAVKKEWGRVDILVNNAGITRDGLLMIMKEKIGRPSSIPTSTGPSTAPRPYRG